MTSDRSWESPTNAPTNSSTPEPVLFPGVGQGDTSLTHLGIAETTAREEELWMDVFWEECVHDMYPGHETFLRATVNQTELFEPVQVMGDSLV